MYTETAWRSLLSQRHKNTRLAANCTSAVDSFLLGARSRCYPSYPQAVLQQANTNPRNKPIMKQTTDPFMQMAHPYTYSRQKQTP